MNIHRKFNWSPRFAAIAATLTLDVLLITTASAAPGKYRATVVPPVVDPAVPAPFMTGNSLNDIGLVVGNYGFPRQGFLWLPGAGTHSFRTLFPWDQTVALDVNDHAMAGWFVKGSNAARPFVFSFDGGTQVLPTLLNDPKVAAAATAVSANGLVAGWNGTATTSNLFFGPSRAAFWKNGRLTDIGTLGGTEARATAVNRSGIVVGYSTEVQGGELRAFRWSSARGLEALLNFQQNGASRANDLNEAGRIVGDVSFTDESGRSVQAASIWSPDGQLKLLPRVLSPGQPGEALVARAVAINNRGQVVGAEVQQSTFLFQPVLWEDGQGYTLADLVENPPAGVRLDGAVDINEFGAILLGAFDTAANRTISVLLSPIEKDRD